MLANSIQVSPPSRRHDFNEVLFIELGSNWLNDLQLIDVNAAPEETTASADPDPTLFRESREIRASRNNDSFKALELQWGMTKAQE